MLRKTGPGKVEEIVSACPIVEARLYNFDFDGSDLKVEHEHWLDQYIVEELYHPRNSIWMRGSSSKVGKKGYNLKLSERRVQSVEEYLLCAGISPSQIQTDWVGEEMSTSTKDDDERDRAVEIHMQGQISFPTAPAPKPPKTPPPAPPTTRNFRLRVLGGAQVSKTIDLSKALKRVSKLAKLKKLPKVGLAVDAMYMEVQDKKNGISGYYIYVAPGIGAGAYWVSAQHKGPWNDFTTSKAIMASEFDGPARFTTAGVGPLSKNILHLMGTPPGVKSVYMEIETGFSWGAGLSTTAGGFVFLDSAKTRP